MLNFNKFLYRLIADVLLHRFNVFSVMFSTVTIKTTVEESYNGKVYNLSVDGDETFICDGFVTHNCRSTTVPVLDESLDFLDEGATRASVDGPVDANETYYSWLKKQPKGFQDSAIGKTRGNLLRNGGLSADEFAKLNLNRNFEPLTLDEMQAKAPEVFERAGVEV